MAKTPIKKPKKKGPGTPPPPEHTRWKKGSSGNPNGRPKELPELKHFKNLTKKELVEVGNLVIKNDVATLKRLAASESATVLQRMLASVCAKVITKGDMQALDILLNRLIGKVRDEVHNTGNANDSRVIVNLPSNGREVKDVS